MGASAESAQTTTRRNLFLGVLALSGIFLLFRLSLTDTAASLKDKFMSKHTPDPNDFLTNLPPPLEHGLDARLEWDGRSVPESVLVRHVPGEPDCSDLT